MARILHNSRGTLVKTRKPKWRLLSLLKGRFHLFKFEHPEYTRYWRVVFDVHIYEVKTGRDTLYMGTRGIVPNVCASYPNGYNYHIDHILAVGTNKMEGILYFPFIVPWYQYWFTYLPMYVFDSWNYTVHLKTLRCK